MARVIAYDDAKVNQRIVGGKYKKNVTNVQTPFFGGKDTPNLPLITMRGFGAGRYSPPHFHDVNQFQIMVGGKGKLGRRDIKANTVHFSRAYTPYGPLVADDKEGLECLIIRERLDTGAFHSPEELASLSKMPDRHPWQITRDVTFPELDANEVSLQPVPEMHDDQGLATYSLSMRPGGTTFTPDPSTGNGLFIIVFKGSLIHQNKESKALTVVYVSNKEPKFEIRAGSEGLSGLVAQFPQAMSGADGARDAKPAVGSKTWHCSLCSFVYDEKVGLPGDGIAPGTRWEDVPETWTCPDCTAGKADFKSG